MKIDTIESLTNYMRLTDGGVLTLSILKWLATKIFIVKQTPFTEEEVNSYFISTALGIINKPETPYKDRLLLIEQKLLEDLEQAYYLKFQKNILDNLYQNSQ